MIQDDLSVITKEWNDWTTCLVKLGKNSLQQKWHSQTQSFGTADFTSSVQLQIDFFSADLVCNVSHACGNKVWTCSLRLKTSTLTLGEQISYMWFQKSKKNIYIYTFICLCILQFILNTHNTCIYIQGWNVYSAFTMKFLRFIEMRIRCT